MKTVLTKFLAISSVALLMLASCKKEGTLAVSNGGKPGALTANVTTLALDKTKVNDTTKVIMFNFTKTSYGFNAAATNTLQIDVPSDNWAHPTTFTLGTGVLSQGFSTPDFNNLILKLNIPGGTTAQVNVRVANSLSANVAPVYSNTLSLTVTPFNLTSWIYITGAFAGWVNTTAPSAEDSLISATGNGIYTGIINFNATGSGNDDFLILPVKGSWAHKYATTQSGQTSSTVTYDAANNLVSPGNGYYIVTFDSNAGTISFAPADFYSLIGNDFAGQNWDTDNLLKYVNDGNGNWTTTIAMIAPSGGGFKIRQDAAWNNSWGLSGTAGVLTNNNGGNITISSAGTYKVSFTMPATPLGTNTTNPLTAAFTISQ